MFNKREMNNSKRDVVINSICILAEHYCQIDWRTQASPDLVEELKLTDDDFMRIHDPLDKLGFGIYLWYNRHIRNTMLEGFVQVMSNIGKTNWERCISKKDIEYWQITDDDFIIDGNKILVNKNRPWGVCTTNSEEVEQNNIKEEPILVKRK